MKIESKEDQGRVEKGRETKGGRTSRRLRASRDLRRWRGDYSEEENKRETISLWSSKEKRRGEKREKDLTHLESKLSKSKPPFAKAALTSSTGHPLKTSA